MIKGAKKKILYVVNDADFFLSHRLPIAKAAQASGYEVHIATPMGASVKKIVSEGLAFYPIALDRSRANPLSEIKSLWSLYRLYRELQPDLVHHVTIKPILYGGMMARLARVPAVVSAVSGLGYLFLVGGIKGAFVRLITKKLYRLALGKRNFVIFQNPDDLRLFLQNGLVDEFRSVLIKGSGVDINKFTPVPISNDIPTVVLASRMLWDKGVGEFVEAAGILLKDGIKARFILVGDADQGNPASIEVSQLKAWNSSGIIEWWGRRDDIQDIFAKSNIVCLPSYREGLPKVLIEAAACGRPIVSTDVPGCREIVKNEENGLLVPAHNPQALASALRRLIENPLLCESMGAKGRELAVREYSEEKVVRETLSVYRDLLI